MEEKSPITVAVLDEPFSQLHKAGNPLSLCTHKEKSDYDLGEQCGQPGKQKLGFSISFWGDQCVFRTSIVRPIT